MPAPLSNPSSSPLVLPLSSPPPSLTIDMPPNLAASPYALDSPSPSPPPTSTYPPHLLSKSRASWDAQQPQEDAEGSISPRLLDLSPSSSASHARGSRRDGFFEGTSDVFSVHASRADLSREDKYGEEEGSWAAGERGGEGRVPLLGEEEDGQTEKLSGWRTRWGWKRRKVLWVLGGAVLAFVLLLGAASAKEYAEEMGISWSREGSGVETVLPKGGQSAATTGGEGSVVQLANGGSFMYRNEL